MTFRISLPIRVERQTHDLSDSVQVDVQIVYQGGRWRGQCAAPPMITHMCDSMQEAIVAAAKELIRNWELDRE